MDNKPSAKEIIKVLAESMERSLSECRFSAKPVGRAAMIRLANEMDPAHQYVETTDVRPDSIMVLKLPKN